MKEKRNSLAEQLHTMLQGQAFTPERGLEMCTDGVNVFTLANRSDTQSACMLRLRIHLDGWDKNIPDEEIDQVRKEAQESLEDPATSYTARQMLNSLDRPRIVPSQISGIELSLSQTLPDGVQIQRKAITDEDGIAQFNYLIWDSPCLVEVVNLASNKLIIDDAGDSQVSGFNVSVEKNHEKPKTRNVAIISSENDPDRLACLRQGNVVWLSRKEGSRHLFQSIGQGEYELIAQIQDKNEFNEEEEIAWAAASEPDTEEQVLFHSPDGNWQALLQPGDVNQSDVTIYYTGGSGNTPKISISIGSHRGYFKMEGSGNNWEGSVTLNIAYHQAKGVIPVVTVEFS